MVWFHASFLAVIGSVMLAPSWRVGHAAPMNRLNKGPIEEDVVLPDGYELTRCTRFASQNDSRLLICLNSGGDPVLLTISAVKDVTSSSTRDRSPPQGKYLISSRTSHFVPRFLRRCSPVQPIQGHTGVSTRAIYNCHDSSSQTDNLRVGLAHHFHQDKHWIEVVVEDRADDSLQDHEAHSEIGRDRHQAKQVKQVLRLSNEAKPHLHDTVERNDCTDEYDPNCDLESARDEDN